MWVARNKDGTLNLFTGDHSPVRNFPIDNPKSSFWGYNMNSDDDIIPLYKSVLDDMYNNIIFDDMFKNLKWEDEPVEIVVHEKYPVNEITCLDCGAKIKYTFKDIESFTYENPWNAGGFEHEDCVKCPECGKYVIISHY